MAEEIVCKKLVKIHEEAMKAANVSWTETDKLYVSVCSALITLAALFGAFASKNPGLSVSLVGALVFLLSINWALLIGRYQKKILSALDGLAQEHGDSRISKYYQEQQRRFKHDRWRDYLIVGVVVLASVILILYPICLILVRCNCLWAGSAVIESQIGS